MLQTGEVADLAQRAGLHSDKEMHFSARAVSTSGKAVRLFQEVPPAFVRDMCGGACPDERRLYFAEIPYAEFGRPARLEFDAYLTGDGTAMLTYNVETYLGLYNDYVIKHLTRSEPEW